MNIFKNICCALVLASCCGCILDEEEDSYSDRELLPVGTEAPDIEMKTYDGQDFSLKGLRGSYVVLEFWASWCPDCQKEMLNFQRIFNEYGPKGIRFVGFSFDDDEAEWKNAIQEYGLDYIHVSEFKHMRESETAEKYGINWIPTMYLLDPDGKILLGTVETTELEKSLSEIISE